MARSTVALWALNDGPNRFNGWSRRGIWKRTFDTLAAKSRDSLYLIDSTIVKAHRATSGAKGGRKIRQSASVVLVAPQKSMPSFRRSAFLDQVLCPEPSYCPVLFVRTTVSSTRRRLTTPHPSCVSFIGLVERVADFARTSRTPSGVNCGFNSNISATIPLT